MSLTLPAPAKLNLFLHITGQRADGYHTLQTVFQLLDYGDELTFSPTLSSDIVFTCNTPQLQNDSNLVLRAARLLQERVSPVQGCRIHLQKRLPAGGGLGGGSSDAATTLLALDHLWKSGLTIDELSALGLSLGADVPVFLRGHTAWAEGVGEQLQTLTLPQDWFVVLSPPCNVATAAIFSHPQLTRNSAAIRIPAFPFSGSKNDCQSVTCQLYPAVQAALDWLGNYGDARMTGTGSSVFARFASREQAEQVLKMAPATLNGFVAKGCNSSPLHRALYRL